MTTFLNGGGLNPQTPPLATPLIHWALSYADSFSVHSYFTNFDYYVSRIYEQ